MADVISHGVKLTDTAVSKVRHLLQAEGRDDLRLRVQFSRWLLRLDLPAVL